MGGLVAAAGAAGLTTGTAAAATTRRGIEFDRVIDVVDDLGCDPTGGNPVQGAINDAEQEGTLFVFPEGEYLLTDRLLLMYNDTVGILGKGDARFVVPENYNDEAVIIDRGQRLLFENVDLDLRADGATPGYKFGAHDEAEIRDVELIGQGIHTGNSNVTAALYLVGRREGAQITVENFVAQNRGRMGAYNRGDGRTGVWVGRSNEGTVTMRNCHVSGFPNNGLYTSRTPGVVEVEGGVFRNNDISQVRLGSEGSYVEGALIEVDPTMSDSPNPEDMLNGRGVRIESGSIKTGGVTVRDCDIHVAENANSEGGVIVAGSGGEFDVVDTRIKVDDRRSHGVRAKRPTDGDYAPPWPRRGRLKNVSVTGSADQGQAVKIKGRTDSVVDACCIQQSGNDRGAIQVADSGGMVVKNSTLNVTGETFEVRGTNLEKWGNSTSGSCPLPGDASVSTAGGGDDGDDATGESVDDERGGDDGGGNDAAGSTKRVRIAGSGGEGVSYSVKVSGEIEGTWASEDGEVTSSSTASGWAGKWGDAFEFTGEIEKLVVRGTVTFVYDAANQSATFKRDRGGRTFPYSLSMGDAVWRTDTSGDADVPTSTGGGERVEGALDDDGDRHGCTGSFRSAEVEDVFTAEVSTD